MIKTPEQNRSHIGAGVSSKLSTKQSQDVYKWIQDTSPHWPRWYEDKNLLNLLNISQYRNDIILISPRYSVLHGREPNKYMQKYTLAGWGHPLSNRYQQSWQIVHLILAILSLSIQPPHPHSDLICHLICCMYWNVLRSINSINNVWSYDTVFLYRINEFLKSFNQVTVENIYVAFGLWNSCLAAASLRAFSAYTYV